MHFYTYENIELYFGILNNKKLKFIITFFVLFLKNVKGHL